ncbi:MAG TPA: hypothetical protein VE263_03110 [Candidatus Angelobacter sp.]|nr:hypothetical protein [Candidatus Angelobacter sp.]
MKTLTILGLFLLGANRFAFEPATQQNTAKTDIPGAGPCTNFPARYQKLEERLAWFHGCMHEDPPSIKEIREKIAALSPDKREKLKGLDMINQEALIGIAEGDVPIQVMPK